MRHRRRESRGARDQAGRGIVVVAVVERLGAGVELLRYLAAVEFVRDGLETARWHGREVSSFRKVLAEEPVGVLVGSALPWARGFAEVDRDPGRGGEGFVLGHLLALVPGQAHSQSARHCVERRGQRRGGRRGGSAFGKRDEHRVAALGFDQGRNCGTATAADDQVAFPVPWRGPVVDLRGPVLDEHHVAQRASLMPPPWPAMHPTSTEPFRQLTRQRPPRINEQRLIDRLVRHPHLGVIGEVDAKPSRDLLTNADSTDARPHYAAAHTRPVSTTAAVTPDQALADQTRQPDTRRGHRCEQSHDSPLTLTDEAHARSLLRTCPQRCHHDPLAFLHRQPQWRTAPLIRAQTAVVSDPANHRAHITADQLRGSLLGLTSRDQPLQLRTLCRTQPNSTLPRPHKSLQSSSVQAQPAR